MNLTNNYREHKISYDGCSFEISLDDRTLTNKPKTLEACITWIDNRLKETWVRNLIFIRDYKGEVLEATATSVIDSSHLWVIYIESQRHEKMSINYCLEVSDTNKQKLAQIDALTKQISELAKERGSIENSLEKFDISKMYPAKEN